MRLVTYEPAPSIQRFGALAKDGRIVDLEGAFTACLAQDMPADRARGLARVMTPPDAQPFIEGGEICLSAGRRAIDFVEKNLAAGRVPTGPRGEKIVFEVDAVKLKAPLKPRKFIAAGKNYFAHQQEMQQKADPTGPRVPIAHVQFASTVTDPDATVKFPRETRHMDYEVEIAVVIGKPCYNVPRDKVYDYVFGYTIFNDLTDRDMYRGENSQGGGIGCLGKNLEGFSPLGPYLATKDEIPNPQDLLLESRINGEVRQHDRSSLMMFKIDEQIAHWSKIGLEPGDMLGSGTPGGVAMGRKHGEKPWWLKRGDVVECEVEGLGVLRTRIA